MILRFLFISFFCFLSSLAYAKEPLNLAYVKQEFIQYHDSGEYDHQIEAVAKEVMYYLRFRINQNKRIKHPQRLAIVFDIDETVLTNYPDMVRLNFGGTLQEIDQLESQGHDPAIPATQVLYRYAIQHGVAVFFITGRKEYERAATARNLAKVGFERYAGLYLKQNNYRGKSAATYKIAQRIKIEKMGYDIVENVGDQKSDLSGGHADMVFKLPNPFYIVN